MSSLAYDEHLQFYFFLLCRRGFFLLFTRLSRHTDNHVFPNLVLFPFLFLSSQHHYCKCKLTKLLQLLSQCLNTTEISEYDCAIHCCLFSLCTYLKVNRKKFVIFPAKFFSDHFFTRPIVFFNEPCPLDVM